MRAIEEKTTRLAALAATEEADLICIQERHEPQLPISYLPLTDFVG